MTEKEKEIATPEVTFLPLFNVPTIFLPKPFPEFYDLYLKNIFILFTFYLIKCYFKIIKYMLLKFYTGEAETRNSKSFSAVIGEHAYL